MQEGLFNAVIHHERVKFENEDQPRTRFSLVRVLERTEIENGWSYLVKVLESPIFSPGSLVTISHSDMVNELDLVRAKDAKPVPSLSDTTKTLREVILEAKANEQTLLLKGFPTGFVDLMGGFLFRDKLFDIFIPDFYLDQKAYLARDGWVLHDEGAVRSAIALLA